MINPGIVGNMLSDPAKNCPCFFKFGLIRCRQFFCKRVNGWRFYISNIPVNGRKIGGWFLTKAKVCKAYAYEKKAGHSKRNLV